MSQAGYTPISLYYSTTAAATPSAGNLVAGELALNTVDEKLYFKNSAGTVKLLASNATSAPVLSFQTSLGGLTPSTATTGVVTLAGTLNTTSGGTGLTSFTAGDVPYYASGSVLSKLAIGTAGQFLTSTGTAPQWSTLSGVAVTTFSAGTTGFTPSSATSGAVTLAGTLATTNGGTNLTSFTSGGVVYASSSSALATGSNLYLTGTTLNVVGTNASINIDGGGVGGIGNTLGVVGTSYGYVGTTTSTPLVFNINSAEQMRLTSTGLGIGTSSPSVKLETSTARSATLVSANFGTSGTGAVNDFNKLTLRVQNTLGGSTGGAAIGAVLEASASNRTGLALYYDSGSGTQTEGFRLDSLGNLGINITPSAWSTQFKALQFGNAKYGTISQRNNSTSELNIGWNVYNTSTGTSGSDGWVGLNTGDASSLYMLGGATHTWLVSSTAATANSAVTWTASMAFNSSGNLYLNGTSGYNVLGLEPATAIGSGGVNYITGVNTTNIGFKISTTEIARFDTSGNLLVGTTTSTSRLVVATKTAGTNTITLVGGLASNFTGDSAINFQGYNSSGGFGSTGTILVTQDASGSTSAGRMTFSTSAAGGGGEVERARINSIGYFHASNNATYVGATGDYHELTSSGTNTTLYIASTNSSSPAGLNVSYRNADPNGTSNQFIFCEGNAATQRMSVRSNGGIANYSANDVNLSDRREKTNFAPATSYLDKICAIPVQTFNYIDQNMEDDDGLTLGVVAQDVQAVAPELVMESNWASKDVEPKMRLSIYQTDLQYALMKCIQEQQAIIESLKARLDAANL